MIRCITHTCPPPQPVSTPPAAAENWVQVLAAMLQQMGVATPTMPAANITILQQPARDAPVDTLDGVAPASHAYNAGSLAGTHSRVGKPIIADTPMITDKPAHKPIGSGYNFNQLMKQSNVMVRSNLDGRMVATPTPLCDAHMHAICDAPAEHALAPIDVDDSYADDEPAADDAKWTDFRNSAMMVPHLPPCPTTTGPLPLTHDFSSNIQRLENEMRTAHAQRSLYKKLNPAPKAMVEPAPKKRKTVRPQLKAVVDICMGSSPGAQSCTPPPQPRTD